MIHQRQQPRFTFESLSALRIVGKALGKKFDRDTPTRLDVGSLVHITIPPETRCAVIS